MSVKALFKGLGPRVKKVDVEGYGTFYVRVVGLEDRERYSRLLPEGSPGTAFQAGLVVTALCEEDGTPCFTGTDEELLAEINAARNKDAALMDRLGTEASGFGFARTPEGQSHPKAGTGTSPASTGSSS